MTGHTKRFKAWFFEGIRRRPQTEQTHKEHWWRVMCLTGVDYFSSMGFQPGISFLAAGILSPLATLNLVIVTLFGALPAYWLVSKESPLGQGSVGLFERILKGWVGKTCVLALLGFAATDFVFTITMCAADATAHIVQNPWTPEFLHNRLIVTLVLIALLGVIFLKGFHEAIQISFWMVVAYLGLNVYALTVCVQKIAAQPHLIDLWMTRVHHQYPSPLSMLRTSALVFPQLALGMSGFETGVAVMPLIKAKETDENSLAGRIRNTRILLVTVALIMSVFLIVGSFVTTLLIPPELFQEGQPANGRALSYLTHLYINDTFGAFYDASTILILWFAGASGMAALLSLVPQYLPRYGMAPSWAAAQRPLIVLVIGVCFAITLVFRADVDSQAGAFATGLLVMITSAVVAITVIAWNRGFVMKAYFVVVSAVFIYASVAIMFARPDGLAISLLFIASILVSSLVSRALRSTELRVEKVQFDEDASRFIRDAHQQYLGEIRLLAHKAGREDYAKKEREARKCHSIQEPEGNFIFLEVTTSDASEFVEDVLEVRGCIVDGYNVLRCSSGTVPNAIAAVLLHIRNETGKTPHAYFGWTEGHPLSYVLKYVLFGEGETAPLTREILRSAEPDAEQRPFVHVG